MSPSVFALLQPSSSRSSSSSSSRRRREEEGEIGSESLGVRKGAVV